MENTSPKHHTGHCQCNAVQIVAKGKPVVVAQCHCEDCQRSSGTGHTTGAMFATDSVTITGKAATFTYTSARNTTVTKTFCPICSSPVSGQNSAMTDHITLPVGIFDDLSAFLPEVVVFAVNRPHWDQIDPALMSFETQPDWSPEKD